jgi:hypothetical protein
VLEQKQPADMNHGGEDEAAAVDAGAEVAKVEVAAAGDESPAGEDPSEVAKVEVAAADDESPAAVDAGAEVAKVEVAAADVANHIRPNCQMSVEFLAQMELHPLVGYHVPSARFRAVGL